MEQLTDEQLIGQVRQGSQDAYRLLVERHKAFLFTLIRTKVHSRETAEDLAQEVFLKLYRSLDGFRGEAKLTTWLYRIALNTVKDYERSRKRRPTEAILDTVRGWFGSRREEPEARALENEERELILRILKELPEKYRDILYLHYCKELSYQELSRALGLPVKTVETRLYRGKALLKKKWLEVYVHASRPSDGAAAAAVSGPKP